MKVGISGTRLNDDYETFELLLEGVLCEFNENPDCIITGGAKGVDTMAGQWATEHNVPLHEHKPDYKKHGSGAPFIRNREIVDECDVLIGFPLPNGESHGTMFTIKTAREQGKKVYVRTLNRTINI